MQKNLAANMLVFFKKLLLTDAFLNKTFQIYTILFNVFNFNKML